MGGMFIDQEKRTTRRQAPDERHIQTASQRQRHGGRGCADHGFAAAFRTRARDPRASTRGHAPMLPLRQEAPRLRPWRRPSSLASSGFRLLEVEPVADMPRVDRPRCGAVVTMVPWAEPGSRFTRDSESECTWLMSVANRKTVSGFLHVAWRTAGDIVRRVADRLRAAMPSPFDGLAAIGVDTARATRIRPWSDARTPRASSTVHGGSRNRCACSGSPLDRAGGELNRWVFRASHSRIPEIVELSKKKSGDAAPTSHAPSNRATPTPGSRPSTTGSRSPSAWPTASTASPTSSP